MISSIFIFISSYFISYFILFLFQRLIQFFRPHIYSQLSIQIWINLYCTIVVIVSHYIWLYCHRFYKKDCGNYSYFLFPVFFLIPIYLLFIYNYVEGKKRQRQEMSDEKNNLEDMKWNRITTHIFVLIFLFQILFYFLKKEYQVRILQGIESLFLFELI